MKREETNNDSNQDINNNSTITDAGWLNNASNKIQADRSSSVKRQKEKEGKTMKKEKKKKRIRIGTAS